MDFLWNEEQEQIRDAVERACAPFDADYWLRKDHEGGFPHDFHKALADAGWLGIAMPEEFGGAGLGISEAALMMHTISATGAGLSGASAVQDRKSTRLNSSHLVISYAVFCLKKKKNHK